MAKPVQLTAAQEAVRSFTPPLPSTLPLENCCASVCSMRSARRPRSAMGSSIASARELSANYGRHRMTRLICTGRASRSLAERSASWPIGAALSSCRTASSSRCIPSRSTVMKLIVRASP